MTIPQLPSFRIRFAYPEDPEPTVEIIAEKVMDDYGRLLALHKQLILYGPPGTGKTWTTNEIARRLLGTADVERDPRFKRLVFHPSFEYEQFIRGLRPQTNSEKKLEFRTVEGHFLQMCWRALFLAYLDLGGGKGKCGHALGDLVKHTRCLSALAGDQAKICVLAIDEINRGNLPTLLGEMVYGLEMDKRGTRVDLPYPLPEWEELHRVVEKLGGNETQIREFYESVKSWDHAIYVPHNLLIVGTMNTSDRSIGAIDAAIRRRFPLLYLGPDANLLASAWGDTKLKNGSLGSALRGALIAVNDMFKEDPRLMEVRVGGLGHSYFLPATMHAKGHTPCDCIEHLADQIRLFVQPLLREYHELGIAYRDNGDKLKKLVDGLDRAGRDKGGAALVEVFVDAVEGAPSALAEVKAG